jgi:hypothetical protein
MEEYVEAEVSRIFTGVVTVGYEYNSSPMKPKKK